jgi:hypothetical protein
MATMPLRIVAISDTHGLHAGLAVPEGDILIHAGDLTMNGDEDDVIAFNDFLEPCRIRTRLSLPVTMTSALSVTPNTAPGC